MLPDMSFSQGELKELLQDVDKEIWNANQGTVYRTPVEDHVAQAALRGEHMHQALKSMGVLKPKDRADKLPGELLAFDDPASHPAVLRMMAKRLDDLDQLGKRREANLREHVDATKRALDAGEDYAHHLAKRLDNLCAPLRVSAERVLELDKRLGAAETKLEENTMSRATGLKLIDRIAALESEAATRKLFSGNKT
jgi:hypothetical protein